MNTAEITVLEEVELNDPIFIEALPGVGHVGKLVADHMIDELDANGYPHKGEAGNFIFIKPKTDPAVIVARMKEEKKILIKWYKNVGGMGDFLRVSTGERELMQIFIDALLEIDK